MRYIYTLLFYAALPFIFLRLAWRSRRTPAYRHHWGERLGFSPITLSQCIWVHSVSVGETLAAIPLIKALQVEYPHLPLVVTNMTPTGAARVKAALGNTVYQLYIPYDLPDAIHRFLKRIQPKLVIVMETELWPNLFAICKHQQIPLIVTNARLSQKSARGYAKIKSLTSPMLQAITAMSSQGYSDAERFIALGMPKEKIHITGNLKFDLELPHDLESKTEVLRNQLGQDRLIWIAASTHPTEEEIILTAHRKIREAYPDALLILVPRHPDRFNAIAELIKQQDLTFIRRSTGQSCLPGTAVYLGDTMGELLFMYAAADVAFIAGSFARIGGHNMLEPAALHKPIITGPHLHNFAEISEMLFAANAMIQVNNSDELTTAILRFFDDAKYREKIGKNAWEIVKANQGALKKQLDLIRSAMV